MKKAGDLLSTFFDEATLKKAQGFGSLFSSWASIAGENLAAHSRIVELEHSVLLVEADHPGWIQILQTKQKALLHGVRRRFPQITVTAISFRLSRNPAPLSPVDAEKPGADPEEGPVRSPGGAGPGTAASPEADTEDPGRTAAGTDPYAGIHDEAFKQTLMRLEQGIKRRKK
jgi:hypothetical protein